MTTDLTLAERVALLERRDLTLSDLPLAALQRKLENDWQPDAAVLMQPNSITVDQLASGQKFASGTAVVNFVATTVASTIITHGLGLTPRAVVALPILLAGEFLTPSVIAGTVTSNQATIQFVAGAAVTISRDFYWIAVA